MKIATPIAFTILIAVGCALEDPAPAGTGGSAGSSGSSGTSGGAGTGGTSGGAGTGGASAGSGGSGLTSGTGGGSAGTGGGSAGTGGGSAGTGGGDAGTGGGGGPDPLTFASQLHGHVITLDCLPHSASSRTCSTSNQGCPNNSDPVLDGAIVHDETLTMGGDPNVIYNVTVHVQGQVEGKRYINGAMDASVDDENGFVVGGAPDFNRDDYNVYAMRVSDPQEDYFFNSIANASGDLRIRHATFDIDYTATIPIRGGATLRMVAADENCTAIANCIDVASDTGPCTTHQLANLDPVIDATINQPYDGQFVGFVVTAVTPQ